MLNRSLAIDQKRNWNRGLLLTVLRKAWHVLNWLHGEIKAEYSQSNRIWGTCLYYGPGTDCFGVPRLRPDWAIETKRTALVSCMEVFSKHKGKALRDWQTVNYKGTWKRKIRNLTFACDSLSSYLGHAFAWAAGVSLRSLQVTRPKQNGCQGGSSTE